MATDNGPLKIIAGKTSYEFASSVAEELGICLTPTEFKRFANGETYVRICDTIRRKDVFIVQNTCKNEDESLNDSLMETLLLIDAAKRASANEIIVVFPFMPYARQDRKAREREPISVALVLKLLKSAGASRILTMDLHSSQTQGAFDGPFDHISAHVLLKKELADVIKSQKEEYIIVAPDAGSVKKSSQYAIELGIGMVFLPKMRDKNDSSIISRPLEVEGIKGKKCIIIDDMIDTGGTLISAAEMLKKAGAKEIICAATHGLLSGNACEKIWNSSIDNIILTDTLPQREHEKKLQKKIKIISVSSMFAKTINKIEKGESLLDLD